MTNFKTIILILLGVVIIILGFFVYNLNTEKNSIVHDLNLAGESNSKLLKAMSELRDQISILSQNKVELETEIQELRDMFSVDMKTLSREEARVLAESYVNSELVSGSTANVSEIMDYNSSLYKLTVMMEGGSIESFMSKDGKIFFPQGMDTSISSSSSRGGDGDSSASASVIPSTLPKSEKPVIELFVMSHCPFGLQLQKGILPVISALGNKVDFKLKFVNYSMHDKIEIDEQARQYCIDKEQPQKLIPYLNCFVKAGDSTTCSIQAGLDRGKISSCVAKADSDYKLTANYNDKTTHNGQFPPFFIHDADNKKYGVQGSPTLIINGKEVSSSRDSQSLMTTICAAFHNQPPECSKAMSTDIPSTGFGY